MRFFVRDVDRLRSFYLDAYRRHGVCAQGVGWSSTFRQLRRFEVLCEVDRLEGKSILDVGCGFGDLYAFLKERLRTFTYVGIDIVTEYIEIARKRYPDVPFVLGDYATYEGPMVDTILSSGALTFQIRNAHAVYHAMIRNMFERSHSCVALTVLSNKAIKEDDTYVSYSVFEMSKLCRQLTNHYSIREDYLPEDIAVYLYRS
jgi:SAM-dependent methyltransferase